MELGIMEKAVLGALLVWVIVIQCKFLAYKREEHCRCCNLESRVRLLEEKSRTAREEKVWREKEMNEIAKTILLSAVTALITVLVYTKLTGS